MIIVATTTWNSVDIIERFLSHYKKLGVHKIMVMDFHSNDGTQEILSSRQWRDFISLVPFPGIVDLDSSNIMLSLAKKWFGRDVLCLFCDPDEFLVTPSMNIEEIISNENLIQVGANIIPRFNMTGSYDLAISNQELMNPFGALRYRIDVRARRKGAAEINNETLDPPWIFTDIPGKVIVRLGSTMAIKGGDHSAQCKQGETGSIRRGYYLLHYPFRTWEEFKNKIKIAKVDFETNAHLPLWFGWQIRRWIRLSNENKLYAEYLLQFIEADELERLLVEGSLCLDERVHRFNDPNNFVE